jgi:hypothetical protein
MNARHGQFVNRPSVFPGALPARLAGSAALCLALGGCLSSNPFTDAQVDPRSPIAKEVATTVKPDAPYPTFAAIPDRPKDVRPVRQFGVAAQQVDKAAADLMAQTSDDKFTLNDTDTFTAQAQAAAGPEAAPSQAQQAAETEAFAAALRKRATPPPPAKHQ